MPQSYGAVMRIAIVTESFAPDVNGVANSVMRTAEYLLSHGHAVLVVAPRPARRTVRDDAVATHLGYPVIRLMSLPMPGYPQVRLTPPSQRLRQALAAFRPDVVHLASPFILGKWGADVARELGVPIVAVYQTDVAGYTHDYRLARLEDLAWRRIANIHAKANLTLAPSDVTAEQLRQRGVPNLRCWGRGVDTVMFDPAKRSDELRQAWGVGRQLVVGYVGRLAPEKSVHLLSAVTALDGVRVIVVGDGPARRHLERVLPHATFLGVRRGFELAQTYASFDVFVHTGALETFGQTIQEAQASGLPVVAPARGGPMNLVRPGVNGFLVTPGDPAAFAGAVAALNANPAMRCRLGIAGRREVLGRTWAHLGAELMNHYAEVVSGQLVFPAPAPSAVG